jgi:hypothetical protein
MASSSIFDLAVGSSTDPRVGKPATARTALAIAAVALCAYLATGQNLFHGFDDFHYLRSVVVGDSSYTLHALYLPTASMWSRFLAWFGIDAYEAMRALSSFAAAVGVFASHRAAARCGFDREGAALVAIGCASLPAVVHAATVIEIDALTFCGFCCAAVPFATLLRHDAWRAAAAIGFCTGCTSAFHAAGHVGLLALFGLYVCAGWPRRSFATGLSRGFVMITAHATIVGGIALRADLSGQATMVENSVALALAWRELPRVLLDEFLLPYAPFVPLVFLLCWWRGYRSTAIALAAVCAGYLLLAASVKAWFAPLAPFGPQLGCERGSFLIGLAPILVLASVSVFPRWLARISVLLAAISGFTQQQLADWPDDPPDFCPGFLAATERRPCFVLFADAREMALITRRQPAVPGMVLGALHVQLAAARAGGAPVPEEAVTFWIAAEASHQLALGREFVITDGAWTAMEAATERSFARTVVDLPARLRVERIAAAGFAGWLVKP